MNLWLASNQLHAVTSPRSLQLHSKRQRGLSELYRDADREAYTCCSVSPREGESEGKKKEQRAETDRVSERNAEQRDKDICCKIMLLAVFQLMLYRVRGGFTI